MGKNPDGETFLPHVPELRNQPIFGPRMLAMIGWLKSRAHCSYSTIAIWMDDVLQVPVSRGYLAKLCNGTISASLAAMHEQLKQAISRQSRLGSDESNLKNNGKKNWIPAGSRQSKWLTAVNTTCHRTIFALCSSRVLNRPTTIANSRCVTV